MKSTLFLVLGLVGCSQTSTVDVPTRTSSYVRGMSLSSDVDSVVEFDTGKARGSVTIEKGILVGYRNVTVTGSDGGSTSRTILTVNGLDLVIEESALLVGTTRVEPLEGETKVEVKAAGIFLNGKKAAELPR